MKLQWKLFAGGCASIVISGLLETVDLEHLSLTSAVLCVPLFLASLLVAANEHA